MAEVNKMLIAALSDVKFVKYSVAIINDIRIILAKLTFYNLPALHPKLKVVFTYQLEGEYLAITKNKLYAALPTVGEIRICKGMEE